MEIEYFLEENAFRFCIPFEGKRIMWEKVNAFLGNIKFKDLPMECYVSVSVLEFEFPMKPKLRPLIITRENAGDMTVGEVVAASSTVPGLYLPSTIEIEGKRLTVFDGGLTMNPPLNPQAKNVLFSYNNPSSLKPNSWNKNGRWPQEKVATAVFHPYTENFHMLGGTKDVQNAFEFGRRAMEKQMKEFLEKLK